MIWLLYGPLDPNQCCPDEPLLGVFETPELAGAWLYANDAEARAARGTQPGTYPPPAPYPYPFGEHCWWFSPKHHAVRAPLNAGINERVTA